MNAPGLVLEVKKNIKKIHFSITLGLTIITLAFTYIIYKAIPWILDFTFDFIGVTRIFMFLFIIYAIYETYKFTFELWYYELYAFDQGMDRMDLGDLSKKVKEAMEEKQKEYKGTKVIEDSLPEGYHEVDDLWD